MVQKANRAPLVGNHKNKPFILCRVLANLSWYIWGPSQECLHHSYNPSSIVRCNLLSFLTISSCFTNPSSLLIHISKPEGLSLFGHSQSDTKPRIYLLKLIGSKSDHLPRHVWDWWLPSFETCYYRFFLSRGWVWQKSKCHHSVKVTYTNTMCL